MKLGRFYTAVLNKFYFDELYDRLFVRSLPRLGALLWHKGDDRIIDRYGPDGVALATARAGAKLRRVQTGYLYHYAFAMAVGLIALVGWALVQGGV